MEDLKIVYLHVNEITPYERNAKKHTDDDIKKIKASIREFGFDDPIGVWGDKNIIVEGHGRLIAAKELGLDEVPCIRLDHLTDEQRRAYALAHNKTAEFSMWDFDNLASERDEIGIDLTQFGFFDDEMPDNLDDEFSDNRYSRNVMIPQYEPKGELPEVSDMIDTQKAHSLIAEINESDIPEETKDFLRYAAYRHIVFNYKNIAEFYCHQSPEVQRLMEKSALVIIDVNDAIAYGYAKLSDDIAAIMEEDDAE